MINSASGYECIDTTGLSSFITGDILPVRDNRGDGSSCAMKYEDLLFLQEAFHERKAVCSSDYPVDGSVQPKWRAFDTLNFDNVVYFYDSMILRSGSPNYLTEFIDPDKSLSFNFVDATETKIRDELLSRGFDFVDDQTVVSGRSLVADDVRHALWRTKRLKRTLYRFSSLGSIYECTYTHTYKGGPNDGYSYQNTGQWTGELYYTVPSVSISANSRNLRVSFSPNAVTLPRWRANASTGRASRWFFLCACTHSYRGGSPSSTTRYKLVSRTTTNGSPLNGYTMRLLTEQLASSVGFPYDSEPYDTGNDGYTLSVVDAAFVTEHEFPAEIDTLNWNWQPSSLLE